MKGVQRPTSVALANNHHEYTSPVKYSSTSRKHAANRPIDNDDEWIMNTPKRRPPRSTSFSEKGKAQNAAVVENDVNRIIRSVAEESGGGRGGGVGGSASAVAPTLKTPVKSEPRTPAKKQQIASTPVKRAVTTPIKSTVAAAEPKPVNNAVNEISPNRRLAQTKKDNEKKKQMQVSKSPIKLCHVCFFDWHKVPSECVQCSRWRKRNRLFDHSSRVAISKFDVVINFFGLFVFSLWYYSHCRLKNN